MKSKLQIRKLKTSDYTAWKTAQLEIHPSQNKFDFGPAPEITKRAFLNKLRQHNQASKKDCSYHYGVFLRQRSILVGNLSFLHVRRDIYQSCLIGWQIFNNHWGKGYGKEAVHQGFKIAFVDLGLHKIEAYIHPGNQRSIQLAKKLGFVSEGLKKSHLYFNGKWDDVRSYAISAEAAGYKWKSTKA